MGILFLHRLGLVGSKPWVLSLPSSQPTSIISGHCHRPSVLPSVKWGVSAGPGNVHEGGQGVWNVKCSLQRLDGSVCHCQPDSGDTVIRGIRGRAQKDWREPLPSKKMTALSSSDF